LIISHPVLHIASWYPNPSDERLGNFVQEHLKAINTLYPVVLLSAFEADEADFVIEEEPYFQLQVRYKKKWPVQSHYKALEQGFQHLKQIGFNFKMSHLHVTWPSGIVFQGFLKGMPYIITEHYSGYQSQRRPEWSKLAQHMARRILNSAQVICPVSKQLADSMRDFGVQSTIQVIGNVVDTEIFKYQTRSQREEQFCLLHISSLQQETKNITGLIEAFKIAQEQNSRLFLKIGGDGDTIWLNRLLEESGIPKENYQVLSAMSREEVAAEMKNCHAFVLSSFIENQPVVLLESLCVGRPVIATKVGGIPEYIGKKQGELVEPKDAISLAKAMLKIEKEYHLYDAASLAISAQARYSFQAIAEEFEQVYLSVRPSIASDRRVLNPGPQ